MIKNIVTYLCLLTFALCFNIFYYAWFSWILLVTAAVIPLVSLACSLPFMIMCASKGFEVCVDDKALLGQPLSVSVKCRGNKAAFCPTFRLKMRVKFLPSGKSKKQKLTFSGTAAKPFVKKYKTLTEHCGLVEINSKWAKVYDFTGIFFIPVKTPLHLSLCVLPKPVKPKLPIDVFTVTVTGYKPVPLGTSDIYDLREYRRGDSVRSIHWKLSSKTDNLIIRETVAPIVKPFIIRPELDKNNTNGNDKVLSKLRYACEYMIEQTGKCTAVNRDGSVIRIENKNDIENYFSALYSENTCKPCRINPTEARIYSIFPDYEEVSAP